MKNGALRGLIQFILALAVVIVLDKYYFTMLGFIKINPTGNMENVAILVKYVIEFLVAVIIYRDEIFSGKSRFNKSLLTSSIIALVTFIVMVVFTLIVKKVLLNFDMKVSGEFINYFAQQMTFDSALSMIINCFIKPCLFASIFVLGVSNVISKEIIGMVLSGLCYGLYLYFLVRVDYLQLIIPVVNVVALTYLYKSTGNIYTCFITFILYNLCGGLLLSYIV